jgi:transcription initiation factor TFIIIB Brf1 subunit/transcription initiation factor TFIIB
MEKQTDCEVCTGKEVVEDGVCRNCGAGKESDLKESGSESKGPSQGDGSGATEPAKTE